MSSIRRHLVVLGAALCAPVLLSGCGGGGGITMVRGDGPAGGSTETGAPVAATVASLRAAGSATAETESGRFQIEAATAEGTPFMTTVGEFSGNRVHQTTSFDVTAFAPDGDLTDLPTSFEGETILDGGTAYTKSSLFSDLAGMFGGDVGADSWIRFDSSDDDLGDGLGLSIGDSFGADTTELLSGAYGEVTTIGAEDVRGVATTHSRVAVDPSAVVGESDSAARLGGGAFTADVWVDDEGLVRRMRFEVDADALVGEAGTAGLPELGGLVMTFELWDIDASVEIALPPDSAVVDATELFGDN